MWRLLNVLRMLNLSPLYSGGCPCISQEQPFIDVPQKVFLKISQSILHKEKKKSLEVFCKKGCSEKFRKSHWKTPVLESLTNKVAGLQLY